MRIYSIRPVNGPSQGGTLISLIGTGFVDTSKQAIRFTYGGFSMEVNSINVNLQRSLAILILKLIAFIAQHLNLKM